MESKKFLFIFLVVLFLCCGCKAKYTLTYEDDKFLEKIVISDLSSEDKKALLQYDNGNESLKIDEKNSYLYSEDGNNKIYSYDMGEEFVKSPLINTCFEYVNVVDKDDYINISASGEYYCKSYDLEVVFKTDKKVIFSNASKVEGNTYKWDNVEKGIEIHFSKVDLYDAGEETAVSKNASSLYIRLIICIVLVVVFIFTLSYLKKKNSNE